MLGIYIYYYFLNLLSFFLDIHSDLKSKIQSTIEQESFKYLCRIHFGLESYLWSFRLEMFLEFHYSSVTFQS